MAYECHNEARRKEVRYLKKAYIEMERRKGYESAMGGEEGALRREAANEPSSYDRQAQRCQNLGACHTSNDVDVERRQAHLAQQRREYTAKIPGRFSSNDYISQW